MLFSFFIFPTFATEITDPATCDSGTLSTDTGPTNLRANYESNTLNLTFYDNNTLLDVTSTNSGTCTYGSAINLPTVPQKRGYTFKGWKVVPQYDFTTLYNGNAGSAAWGKGDAGKNKPYCIYYGPGVSGWRVGCINNEFDDLQVNEWKSQFSWGMIYGQALCSETSASSEGDIGTPSKTYGDYCWCKATGYHPSNTNTTYVPSNNLPWTYVSKGAGNCRTRCPLLCSINAYGHTGMRRSLFGVSGS